MISELRHTTFRFWQDLETQVRLRTFRRDLHHDMREDYALFYKLMDALWEEDKQIAVDAGLIDP